MSPVKRCAASWAPVIVWMFFIYVMSTSTFSSESTVRIIEPILRYLHPSITEPDIERYHAVIRKMAHGIEYFLLGLLLFRAYRVGSIAQRTGRWVAGSFLVIALYASFDEIHQLFVFGRTASLIDVGIDTLGGLLGLCCGVLDHLRRERQQH